MGGDNPSYLFQPRANSDNKTKKLSDVDEAKPGGAETTFLSRLGVIEPK